MSDGDRGVPEASTPADAGRPDRGRDELVEAQAEIERLCKEILRLRDSVIGKDAELGTALGRVAELKALVVRYRPAEDRLQEILASRSWRLMWAVGRPLRALRSSRGDG